MDDLRKDIHEALHVDLGRARRLVASYARRAARSGDPLVEAIAAFERARIDHRLGRHRRAKAGYDSARRSFLRLREPRHALVNDVDAIQVEALLGEAAAVRRTARRLRGLATNPQQAAGVEIAIGSAQNSLGDERAAEESFRRAVAHLRRRRTPRVTFLRATARHNLAIRLARRGAVVPALKEFDAALAFCREQGMDALAEIVRHNRGWAHGVAGNALDALHDLHEAREAYAARGDDRRAALAQLDEAELLLRLGDHDGAAAAARVAARTLQREAPLEAARGRLLAARAATTPARRRREAQRAHALFRKGGDIAGVAMANVLTGTDLGRAEAALLRQGHWIGALDALVAHARGLAPAAGARLLTRKLKRYPPVLQRWLRPDLYRLRAEAGPRIPLLRRAYRAAEDLRRRAPTGSLRATALAAHLEIYEALARALLDRGRPPDRREAFLVLDAARGRTLREEVDREATGMLEQPRLRKLREQLEALWRSLERRDTEAGGLRSIERRILREVAACERDLVRMLAESDGATEAGDPAAHLPRTPCLAFSVLGGEVTALAVRNGAIMTWSCGRLDDMTRDVEAFRFQVARRLHGATDHAAADAALARLAHRLLREAPRDLFGARLRVVLPPQLGNVPVEALPVEGLETTTVEYAPYACLRSSSWARGGASLLVGIESARLPAVRRELHHLERRMPDAQVLKGRAATRAAIVDALPGRGLIHLAGHAQAREDLPPLSALRVGDGWICAGDLRGVNLRRALIVLSACRTGDPALRWQGEAMGGFPRNFLAAGAAGVIASRWEVSDDVAYRWMRHLYAGLERLAPDRALAAAARAVQSEFPHPADWAAFLLIRGGQS